jgi:hypothetical protein
MRRIHMFRVDTKGNFVLKRSVVIYGIGFIVLVMALACSMAAGGAQTPSVVTMVVTQQPTDQQPAQTCGDGVCTPPEDAAACPADCASAATAVPEDTEAKVKMTEDVHVRYGPSVNCIIIGSYPKDTEVQALAKSPDGQWWQVPFNDTVGWLSIAYTTPVTDVSKVPELPGPHCNPPTAVPTDTPVPPTFTPAPVCGNGVIEDGEQCDTADTCDGISVCSSSCTCKSPLVVTINPGIIIPVAVCGNGKVEAGEQCDGGGCNLGYICTDTCQCKKLIIVQP